MRIRIKLIAAVLAMFCRFVSLAQNKNFPGFYVNLQGNQVKGVFTNYTGWQKNPSLVEFTPNGGTPLVLTPENCSSFAIEGYDKYVAYAGNRLLNPILEQEVVSSKNILSAADQYGEIRTFLREIVSSPQVNIYAFNDNARTNFFYKLQNQAPVELKYKRFFVQNRIVDSAVYREQINNLFGAEIRSRALSNELGSLPYKEESLVAFFERLFAVQKIEHKTKTPSLGWVVSAGASYNMLSVSGDATLDATGKSYDGSVSPLLSLGYLHPIGGTFSKYFLYPHLKLYSYKNEGESFDQRFRKISTFKADVVANFALNVGMYLVNKESVRFFVSAGAGAMILVNNNQKDVRYLLIDGSTFLESETKLSTLSYSFNVTPGIILKNKIVLTATYSPPMPVAFYSFDKPHHSNAQVTVGYKFN